LATGTTPKVIGCEVKWLAGNPNGIECASSNGLVQANVVYGTTTPYVYANGALFLGNFDNLTGTASDSNSDDIIVLNRELGILTTKSLTSLSGADYTLTLTNSLTAS
jgi:hypothetical protein